MNAILCTGDYRGINQGGEPAAVSWAPAMLTSAEFCSPVKRKHQGWVCKWCTRVVKW